MTKVSQILVAAIALASGIVSAQKGTTVKVDVGKDGFTFTPANIQAEAGTDIQFSFFPGDHSVTQAAFSDPCQPIAGGGFFSGFMADSSTTFTITINNTDPIYFSCSQSGHCQAGKSSNPFLPFVTMLGFMLS
jgi:plastocyanin